MNDNINQIATYECFGIVGQGSVATVYEGFDHELKRDVVVKELRAEFRDDAEIVSAFWEEATLLAGLNHPGILRVYGIDRDRYWIIMEPMQLTLASEATAATLTHSRVREVLKQILEGLRFLHSMDCIHGQIRLDSILVDSQGNVKLSNLTGSTVDGEFRVPGVKQLHNAPEILNPKHFGCPGLSTDLYCVGIVALQLLTSDKFIKLFKGMDRKRQLDPIAWSAWHASSEPIGAVQSVVSNIPEDLLSLIDGLTQKQVGLRFATATEAIGVISPQLFSVAQGIHTAVSDESRYEQREDNHGTVTYNSPSFYSPKSAVPSKKTAFSLHSLRQELRNRCPYLFNRKLVFSACSALVVFLFLAISLIPTPEQVVVQASDIAPAADESEPPVRTSAIDFALEEPPAPKIENGDLKLLLLPEPSGPAIKNLRISIDGRAQTIEPLRQLNDGDADRLIGSDEAIASANHDFKLTQVDQHSPIFVSGRIGTYFLTVQADSYQPCRKQIELVANAQALHELKLERKLYCLELNVKPATATVLVDGEPITFRGASKQLQIPCGRHFVQIEAEGFNRKSETIELYSDAKKSYSLEPLASVSLTIDSFPQGAVVEIDGRKVGRTPFPWRGWEGRHKFEFTLTGHRRLSSEIQVESVSDESERLCWYLERSQDLVASAKLAIKIEP